MSDHIYTERNTLQFYTIAEFRFELYMLCVKMLSIKSINQSLTQSQISVYDTLFHN